MTLETLDLSENAAVNAARAELVNAAALGRLLPPPEEIPVEHVEVLPVHVARLERAIFLEPWQSRVAAPSIDMDEVRAELGRAIRDRTDKVAALAMVEDELARASSMLAEIAAEREAEDARVAGLADRLRDWIVAGANGERPACDAPSPRLPAEVAAIKAAHLAVEADYLAAWAAHARAAAAVDRAVRRVVSAEAQALVEKYEEAVAKLAPLVAEAHALLALPLGGEPACISPELLRQRLPPATAEDAEAVARWTRYTHALGDDADARVE